MSTVTRDSHGGNTRTWTTVERLWWAEIRGLSGRELTDARQIVADATHSVRMRYRDDLTSSHRLKLVGTDRILNIDYISNTNERGESLVLLCREAV